MQGEPREPGQRAAQAQPAGQLDHGGPPPDRGHGALVVVPERLGGRPLLQPDDLRGGVPPALDRGLGQLRGGIVRVHRDVPYREDPVLALHPQVGADHEAAALALRQAPGGHPRAGRHAGRPYGDVAGQVLAVDELDMVRGDLADASIQPHVDAAGQELGLGVLLQLGVERAEQVRRHLDQPDAHPCRVDVGEGGAEHGAAQLGQRAGQLHAGGPAADHGDVQVAVLDAEPLEAGHQVIPEHDGVGPGVQAERVFRRALDPVERGRHPGRQDEVVVAEVTAVAELDPAGHRVDRGQLPAAEDCPVPAREAARRVSHVAGVQARGGDLVEQWLEGAVQVAVHQGHPHSCASEPTDGRQSAEPRAADDHVRRVRVSLTSSCDRPHLRLPQRRRIGPRASLRIAGTHGGLVPYMAAGPGFAATAGRPGPR